MSDRLPRVTLLDLALDVDGWGARIYALEEWSSGIRILGSSAEEMLDVARLMERFTASCGDQPVHRQLVQDGDRVLGGHRIEWWFGVEAPATTADLVVRIDGQIVYPSTRSD
jgi:hypothetical protein